MVRDFLPQAYDVCEHACTEKKEFASDINELDSIALGLQAMKQYHVQVGILCRDVAPVVPSISAKIMQLGLGFKSAHVTIIENDSEDGTQSALRNLSQEINGMDNSVTVSVESYVLRVPRKRYGDRWFPPSREYDSPSFAMERAARYHRMSILRNQYLLSLREREDTDFLIVMDADEDVASESLDMTGIAHSFGLRLLRSPLQWNAICANGVSSASGKKAKLARLHRNNSEHVPLKSLDWTFWDTLAFRDEEFDDSNWRSHGFEIHSPYDPPARVESCFGGLMIYDLKTAESLQKCSYRGHSTGECEHLSFNRCLVAEGWKIFLNPRMLITFKRPS